MSYNRSVRTRGRGRYYQSVGVCASTTDPIPEGQDSCPDVTGRSSSFSTSNPISIAELVPLISSFPSLLANGERPLTANRSERIARRLAPVTVPMAERLALQLSETRRR